MLRMPCQGKRSRLREWFSRPSLALGSCSRSTSSMNGIKKIVSLIVLVGYKMLGNAKSQSFDEKLLGETKKEVERRCQGDMTTAQKEAVWSLTGTQMEMSKLPVYSCCHFGRRQKAAGMITTSVMIVVVCAFAVTVHSDRHG
jgi:hypothetical protein